MWHKTAHSLTEMFRLVGVSKEQRCSFNDTVNKLRQHPGASTSAAAHAVEVESDAPTTDATLFDALASARAVPTPEISSVRHWFHSPSTASQREAKTSPAQVHEYNDSTGLGADELNLQFFLTHTAKENAVERFNIKAQEHMRFAVDTRSDADSSADNLFTLKRLNRNEAEDLMLRLGESSNPAVRAALASNKRTPVSVLWKLSEDPAQEVRLALLTNPTSPVPIIENLCRDADKKVSRRAIVHLRNIYKNEVGIAAGNLSKNMEAELDGEDGSEFQGSLDDLENFLDGIAL